MGYLVLGSDAALSDVVVRARTKGGTEVPVALFALDTARLRRLLARGATCGWVVVLPLLADDVVVEAEAAGACLGSFAFPALLSKVASRALTLVSAEAASVLRGFERTHGAGRTEVEILEAWPCARGRVSWRVQVTYPVEVADEAACLVALDGHACPLPAEVHVLEDHLVPSTRMDGRLVRLVTFSCVLDEGVRSFFVVAGLGDGTASDEVAPGGLAHVGFAGMNAPRADGMVATSRRLAGGAATDATYPAWFERHRASEAELAWQRARYATMAGEGSPLFSIVCCVYRTPRAFLAEAIGSVLAQTYGAWELIIVNASGTCAEVDEVLTVADDPRIRVVEVENRSIAENTNAGIDAASGDYVGFLDHDDMLEPDALFCYAQEVAAHPEVDLIYSDEDHLRGDTVASPAFKCGLNLGKLLCHNYVTHLLVVSRRALEATGRSEAAVSGAQDYDLTLRVCEVAREVVHVPRVLYHWREHELSTSGGTDQKPYAHEAGRRALEGHLARRGLAATVEDGPLGCTYHVRFCLPEPAPLVSIVIPTRDQADLVERCVSSILERTTYASFEVILVENNSEEAQTFALYEALEARDARVRVVTWPKSGTGAAFNYSSVVNFGVSCATGDYVCLLNNDTEVIEGDWLQELAGQLQRSEVGLVGAKLLFSDGTIQHVGMVANPDANLCHVCRNLAADEFGAGFAAVMPGDYAMVTGACQMVERALFEELGGYDEGFAVGYNDADFCLRVGEAGYAVAVAERAVLYHREFATRGRETCDARLKPRLMAERSRMVERHPDFFCRLDPMLSPNVDPFSAYFELGRD